MPVDTDRFLQDLDTLRRIGEYKTGVHRPTYSPQDMESRHWLAQQMAEVGLEPTIDGIGNVFGRHKGDGPCILAGSHIETQNYAGWLDGALGVISALALARAGLPVDVCAYADEEGHFGSGFLGSRSLVGALSEDDITTSLNRYDGTPLRDALAAAGLAGRPRLSLQEGRYRGAFEMHIEQGTQLERAGKQIGVVTGIVGIREWLIAFEGKQDHTGGTTMEERKDAGVAMVRLLAAVDSEFPRVRGERSVWTTGRIVLEPNAPAIIPGRAEVTFSFRDISDAVLDRMEACLHMLVRESNRRDRCTASLSPLSRIEPALCDASFQKALARAAEDIRPGCQQLMPSGALHDSQYLARKLPMAMLFVPSKGGVSHHWTEDTDREDLVLGMQVLAEGVRRVLR
jgi:beta-ureidopropionase / N-carbamoyl-L-amino-acid hydrolase